MGIDEIKRQVAIGTRVLTVTGLAVQTELAAGHVSLRVPDDPDLFVVKGRGYEYDTMPAMRASGMVVCNLDGEKVDGPPGILQCAEVKIHSAIFKRYPDVNSVVHVHPPYSILMSVLRSPLVPMGFGSNHTAPPVWPHRKRVFTDTDGEDLASTINGEKAALLLGHGAVTTGSSIADSVMGMWELEQQARMNYLAAGAFGLEHPRLPEELMDEMAVAEGRWEQPHFKKTDDGTDNRQFRRDVRGTIRDSEYRYFASLVEDGVD